MRWLWIALFWIISTAGHQTCLGQQHVSDAIGVIDRIVILGNKVTRDRIIMRELSLKTCDTVRLSALDEILQKDEQKLYNLRLFNTVEIRDVNIFEGNIELIVEVTERWYTFPVPIFDLSDRNFSEWWHNYNHDFSRVNYGIRLYRFNFRGRNETIWFTARSGFSSLYRLKYLVPNIGNQQKIGLALECTFAEPKNLAYVTENHKRVFLSADKPLRTWFGSRISLTYRKSFYRSHNFAVEYSYKSVDDEVVARNSNYFDQGRNYQRLLKYSYMFNAEHRDVVAYPLKGYWSTFFVRKVGPGLGYKINQWELGGSMARHWELKKNLYLSNFTSVYLSFPSRQPYALFGSLGHRNQVVRGYEVYLIEGPRFGVNKTTLKYRLFSKTWNWEDVPIKQFRHFPVAIYWKVYSDMGYVKNYPNYEEIGMNTSLTNKMIWGGGSGIDFVLVYDLVLRFEYSFTREGTHGFFFNIKKEF